MYTYLYTHFCRRSDMQLMPRLISYHSDASIIGCGTQRGIYQTRQTTSWFDISEVNLRKQIYSICQISNISLPRPTNATFVSLPHASSDVDIYKAFPYRLPAPTV